MVDTTNLDLIDPTKWPETLVCLLALKAELTDARVTALEGEVFLKINDEVELELLEEIVDVIDEPQE